MKSTHTLDELKGMLSIHSEKPVIISEGDSWFGYPTSIIPIGHTGTNIIDHIEATENYNILRLESNGDEAKCMMKGRQKAKIIYVLGEIEKKLARLDNVPYPHVHCILFSGGGNDIVGKGDMPRFLRQWESGMGAEDVIIRDEFDSEISQIRLAYDQLIQLRDAHSIHTKIITHGYDNLIPWMKGAVFFLGAYRTGPWIKPFMNVVDIPDGVQPDVVKIMIGDFNAMLDDIAANTDNFIKAETVGTVNDDEWLNEIHPIPSAFGKVAAKIMQCM
ncbi:MAG: hypothetical protein Q9M25_01720 [Mariprofundaceae bacterium]|nr:hypothetical protein [Mariprofundaceae bacterium]